jgi:hypothetical protein
MADATVVRLAIVATITITIAQAASRGATACQALM